MTLIGLLQVLVSVIFFANKIFVVLGKKVGWFVGVVAAALAFFYFLLIGLYVFTVLEVGLIVLMGYGYLKGPKKNPRVETSIQIVMSVLMLVIAVLAFAGLMTVFEFLSSIGMLVGTYYLTHAKERLGWAMYGLAHILSAVVGSDKDQQFFTCFQMLSAVVAAVGVLGAQTLSLKEAIGVEEETV